MDPQRHDDLWQTWVGEQTPLEFVENCASKDLADEVSSYVDWAVHELSTGGDTSHLSDVAYISAALLEHIWAYMENY